MTHTGGGTNRDVFGATGAISSNYYGLFLTRGTVGVCGATSVAPSTYLFAKSMLGADIFTGKAKATGCIDSGASTTNQGEHFIRFGGGIKNWVLTTEGTYMDTITVKLTDGYVNDSGTDTEFLIFPCIVSVFGNHAFLK